MVKKEGDKIKSGDVIARSRPTRRPWKWKPSMRACSRAYSCSRHAGCAGQPAHRADRRAKGEDAKAVEAGAVAAPKAPAAASAAPTASAAPPSPVVHPKGGEVPWPFSSPLARRLAKEAGIDLGSIKGSGPHGRIIAADIDAAKKGGVTKAPALLRRNRPPRQRPFSRAALR